MNVSTPAIAANNGEIADTIDRTSNDSTIGPAFFCNASTAVATRNDLSPAQAQKDPAMFKFEMAMYLPDKTKSDVNNRSDAILQATPVRDDRKPAAMSTPASKTIENGGDGDEENNCNEADGEVSTATVFFRIEDRIFQVDLCQVSGIEKIVHDGDDDESAKLPFLAIRFPVCRFRIFALREEVDPAEEHSKLNAIRIRLVECIESVAATGCQRFDMSLASPSGASTTTSGSSSNELGQRELAPRATSVFRDDDDTNGGSNNSNGGEMGESPLNFGSNGSRIQSCHDEGAVENKTHAMLLKKLSAFEESRRGLGSVEQLLSIPKTTPEMTNEHDELLRRLLRTMGEDFASSYCTRDQLEMAQQSYEMQRQECEKQMDNLLVACLPTSSRPKKKPRRDARKHDEGDQNTINGTEGVENGHSNLSKESILSRAKRILQHHRSLVHSRHAMSQLPHRS